MTNPTSSSSSAPSFLWDQLSSWGQSFNEAQKEIYKFEQKQQGQTFETIWSVGEKLDAVGLNGAGKAAACMTDPTRCLGKVGPKIPSTIAYHGSKMAFEASVSIAKWTGRSVYSLGSTAAGWVKPDFINITTPRIFKDLYNTAADKAALLSDKATSWVTGLPIPGTTLGPTILEEVFQPNTTSMEGNFTSGFGEQFAKGTRTVEQVVSNSNSGFQATELTGPTIALAFCTNRCSKNLFEALHHAKLLVTGKRIVATSYTVPTINSRIPTTITKTKTYTTPALLKDIVIELGFAALWGFGANSLYEGIYVTVLDAAGGNAAHALSVVRTIAFASGAAPFAYEWIKEALYAPASTDSSGQGTEAPKSHYTGSGAGTTGARATTRIPLFRDMENMSFDEAMKVLEERDASLETEA